MSLVMNFIKKCPLHQEMSASSRNGHIMKKWPLHQKMAFFDESYFFMITFLLVHFVRPFT